MSLMKRWILFKSQCLVCFVQVLLASKAFSGVFNWGSVICSVKE